jgi:DNA-binding HxlR family transcriptional regulator
MARNGEEGFDSAKAELFEQLGHPLRIRIIEELYASPLSFSALKSKTSITSNGHLNFHLAKLKDLVSTNEAGEYYLTDTGRDSMRVASMIDWQKHSRRESHSGGRSWRPTTVQIFAALLVASLFLNAGLVFMIGQQNAREMQFRRVMFNQLSDSIDNLWSRIGSGIHHIIEGQYEQAHAHLSYVREVVYPGPFYHSLLLGEGYQTIDNGLSGSRDRLFDFYQELYSILGAVWDGNVTEQQIAYLGGWMNAFGNLSIELYYYQNTDYVIKNSSQIAANLNQFILNEVPSELPITEEEAITLAREFLESRGYGVGALISTEFALDSPNYYWHDIFGMEKPHWRLQDLFWIVSFEQETDASQYLEVWVNIYSGEIKGGGQGPMT